MKISVWFVFGILVACRSAARDLPDGSSGVDATPADVNQLGPVLVIGDSISLGYTPLVIQILPTVQHIPSYSTTTAAALPDLDTWLGATTWSAIHFNFGLHDIDIVSGSGSGAVLAVSPADYTANLQAIVARFQQTSARLIWATTTPVPNATDCPPGNRDNADVLMYNNLAADVMTESGVQIDDLYSVAEQDPADYQMPCDVHMTPDGYAALAASVEQAITHLAP